MQRIHQEQRLFHRNWPLQRFVLLSSLQEVAFIVSQDGTRWSRFEGRRS
jgi:hypothetical protein